MTDGWYYNCKVLQAGVGEEGKTGATLTDSGGSFKDKWFRFNNSEKREMLATALAAIMSERTINIRIDQDTVKIIQLNAR